MNSIRVQINLKYFSDENSSKQFHHFWYAFQPSKLLTMDDIIKDIRENYLKNQISLLIEENNNQSYIISLDDCQLLPFTSSQVLRDNDRLTLMPLMKYKLHKKSLQDSISLNLSSSISIEPSLTISENNHKRERIESTNTITASIQNLDEQLPKKKKIKTKLIEDPIIIPSITQSTPVSPVVAQPTVSQISIESTIEKEIPSEQPLSFPSTTGRIKELKSKTPTWKTQQPSARGNKQDKLHIRFDSDSDEESVSQIEIVNKEKTSIETLPLVNNSNSSIRINYIPTSTSTDENKKSNGIKSGKKTIDLLFEMKQHKDPNEKEQKKIQQQFGKKRAQHRKRALDFFSMANFVDKAFGLDKNQLEQQLSSEQYSISSSTPESLPTSFNKLARLPLVAEAIENHEKMYDLYPPITQCPSIQTRIAFKFLELGEDFCPKMSTYKEGIIINVNENTNELTIQLDKPLETVFNQSSKFYAPPEDPSEEDLTTIILPFSDLNSARLLSTSNEHIPI